MRRQYRSKGPLLKNAPCGGSLPLESHEYPEFPNSPGYRGLRTYLTTSSRGGDRLGDEQFAEYSYAR